MKGVKQVEPMLKRKKNFTGAIDFDFETMLKDNGKLITDLAVLLEKNYGTVQKMVQAKRALPKRIELVRKAMGLSPKAMKQYFL